MKDENAVYPSSQQARVLFRAAQDGPFVMVNQLTFKPKAEYPDGSDPDMTGQEAHDRYGAEVAKLVHALGGRVRYSAMVTGLMLDEVEDLWDAVAVEVSLAGGVPAVGDISSLSRHRTSPHGGTPASSTFAPSRRWTRSQPTLGARDLRPERAILLEMPFPAHRFAAAVETFGVEQHP